MRINLFRIANRPPVTSLLVSHLCKAFADEYVSSTREVQTYLETGSEQFGNYFVDFWQAKGWKITWYKVPEVGVYVSKTGGEDVLGSLSFGFVIDDACEEFMAWRLAHT